MSNILSSLKNQWLGFVLIIFMTLYWVANDNEIKRLENDLNKYQYTIDSLKQENKKSLVVIDSLSKIDTIILTKIKLIKQKEYETIRIIDSMPVSKLQSYFTGRYKR